MTTPRMQTITPATLDDGRTGDHIVWEHTETLDGVARTIRREGIAHHRDQEGDWCTEEGRWITNGEGEDITLTIRRPSTLNPHSKLEDNARDGDNMDTPRYTITRARGRRTRPWMLARTPDSVGPYVVGMYRTHADAVAAMDRHMPLALREGQAYGHTLVVTEDPAAARRRALKARRMAARRRARPARVVPVWEPASARLERVVRESLEATRAEFTLAAPGGDA